MLSSCVDRGGVLTSELLSPCCQANAVIPVLIICYKYKYQVLHPWDTVVSVEKSRDAIRTLWCLQQSFDVTVTVNLLCANYCNRFTTLCTGLPRWVGTRKINHPGFCWSRDDGVAVASAEPHASYLHFLVQKTTMPAPHQSDFYGPDALPDIPTNSVKALKAITSK